MKRTITLKYLIFVVLIVLVQLEIVLQTAGLCLRYYQKYINKNSNSENVIVTLGESTTSDTIEPYVTSWPRQLEAHLIDKTKSVKVVNLATPGAVSLNQFELLTEHFAKTSPRLIITMMGINDSPFFWPRASRLTSDSFVYKIKLVRIFSWLTQPLPQGPSHQIIHNMHYPEAHYLLSKIKQSGQIDEAGIQDLIKNKSSLEKASFYTYMAQQLKPEWGEKDEKFTLSYELYKRSLQESLGILHTAEVFTLLAQSLHRTDCLWLAKKFLHSSQTPTMTLLTRMADCLPEKDETTTAFFDKFAKGYTVTFSSTERPTLDTYQRLSKWAESRNVCVVAMTYPSNSDYNLEKLLRPLASDNFIILNNEPVFASALNKISYDDLFTDTFAQSFGHATTLGNGLISQNLFKLLIRLSAEKRCGLENWLEL